MLKITEYVKPSTIWPNAKDYTDFGPIAGLMRGYNLEVTKIDGTTHWMTANWTYAFNISGGKSRLLVSEDSVKIWILSQLEGFLFEDMLKSIGISRTMICISTDCLMKK